VQPEHLDERLQKNDRNAWTHAYMAADQAAYPAIGRVRQYLPEVEDDAVFEIAVSFVIAGLQAQARHPWTCRLHASGKRSSGLLAHDGTDGRSGPRSPLAGPSG
jgi:hypothetical protein